MPGSRRGSLNAAAALWYFRMNEREGLGGLCAEVRHGLDNETAWMPVPRGQDTFVDALRLGGTFYAQRVLITISVRSVGRPKVDHGIVAREPEAASGADGIPEVFRTG